MGRAEELPAWVFRLWASGNEWNTQARVMAEMDRHREHGVPVGAVVIEAWSDETTFTAFRGAEYEPSEGAAPAGRLHLPGGRPVAGPHGHGGRAARARDQGGRRRPYRNRGWWFPLALMPDPSSREVRDWWTAKRAYLVAEVGVDGFKTGGGEHAWGHDLRYADGRRGADGNNLFPVHYARAFGDLLRRHGKAPVTFSRAGITASACGVVYWGWDLAGFSGDVPGAELYLRAAGAAAFMPIMQYHSEFNHHREPLRDRTPWNVAERTGDERVVPVFRRLAELRERLVPYLAEQAGLPARGRLGGRLDRPPAARRPEGRAARPAGPPPGGLHGGALARPVRRFHDLSRRAVAEPLLPRETAV